MTTPRLFVDAPLEPAASIKLDPGQAHKLRVVLRLGEGAALRLFNGRDGEWAARLGGDRAGAVALVEGQLRPQASVPDLTLLFAPLKRHATDWLVEKATELGVRRLQPVLTRRSVAERVRLDRLETIVREAAEQTERLDLPLLAEPQPLSRALQGWADAPLLYADERREDEGAAWGGSTGRAPDLLAALRSLGPAPALALLIGPEGGFHPEERAFLRSLSFVRPMSLGPRILRAETAAAAGLAVIQAAWGDWAAPLS